MDNLSKGQDVLYVSNGEDPFPGWVEDVKYNAVVNKIDPEEEDSCNVELIITDHINDRSWKWWVYDDEIYPTSKLKQLPYQEGLI